MKGHAGTVHDLQLSRDGGRLLSAGKDGTVRFWDTTSGECVQVLTGAGYAATAVDLVESWKRVAAAVS